jgi:hypothetical protein
MTHRTLGVEGRVTALRWGLKRVTSKSITHMDLHKPNKFVNIVGALLVHRFTTGQTQTHKTHHSPDLGEAITFPFIIYFVPCHRANAQMCRNPSFGLATKARGYKVAGQEEGSPGVKRKEAREQRQRHWKGAGQEKEARESSHTPRSLRKCEGV